MLSPIEEFSKRDSMQDHYLRELVTNEISSVREEIKEVRNML